VTIGSQTRDRKLLDNSIGLSLPPWRKHKLRNKNPPKKNLWVLAELWEWGSVRWEGRRSLAVSTYVKQQGSSSVSDWGSGPTWAPRCSLQHINHPKQGHHSPTACWETHKHGRAHSAACLNTNNRRSTHSVAWIQTFTHTQTHKEQMRSELQTHARVHTHTHTKSKKITQTNILQHVHNKWTQWKTHTNSTHAHMFTHIHAQHPHLPTVCMMPEVISFHCLNRCSGRSQER